MTTRAVVPKKPSNLSVRQSAPRQESWSAKLAADKALRETLFDQCDNFLERVLEITWQSLEEVERALPTLDPKTQIDVATRMLDQADKLRRIMIELSAIESAPDTQALTDLNKLITILTSVSNSANPPIDVEVREEEEEVLDLMVA